MFHGNGSHPSAARPLGADRSGRILGPSLSTLGRSNHQAPWSIPWDKASGTRPSAFRMITAAWRFQSSSGRRLGVKNTGQKPKSRRNGAEGCGRNIEEQKQNWSGDDR